MKRYTPGSREQSSVERADITAQAEPFRETLKEPLRVVIENLRKTGFPLDEAGRINPAAFKGLFSEEELGKDLLKVKQKELGFKHTSRESLGSLLEVAATIFLNKFFNNRLAAVRTTAFDDYFNGVDQIVFDKNTGAPLAMVDTTIALQDKINEIKNKVTRGVAIKYLAGLSQGKVVLTRTLEKDRLPLFILALTDEEVLELAKKCGVGGETADSLGLEQKILNQLLQQSESFARMPNMEEGIRKKYKMASAILKSLLNSP